MSRSFKIRIQQDKVSYDLYHKIEFNDINACRIFIHELNCVDCVKVNNTMQKGNNIRRQEKILTRKSIILKKNPWTSSSLNLHCIKPLKNQHVVRLQTETQLRSNMPYKLFNCGCAPYIFWIVQDSMHTVSLAGVLYRPRSFFTVLREN